MNDSEKDQDRAAHGYRNEVSWDGGKGGQPYGNRVEGQPPAGAAPEVEGGNAGEAAGRNADQLEAVKGFPDVPEREAPRAGRTGRSGGR